jgi:hypothetical protein
MAKFANRGVAPPKGAVKTVSPFPDVSTYEGAPAYSRDAKSDLYLLAVTNMVGEGTFYESAAMRDGRFVFLVRQVTVEDPQWMVGFIGWLRTGANMRTASLVAALEYVRAGGPNGRPVVDSALQRPDEPAEAVGYWLSQYGRNLPKPVRRGVGDAVRRMYNERAFLKYDSQRHGLRMADVIELVHPPSNKAWPQGALYRYVLDDRHHGDAAARAGDNGLDVLALDRLLMSVPVDQRRQVLREVPTALKAAGWTWERLGGWLPGGMDAEAWEAVIPEMGVMALLRNLRNFDAKGISDTARKTVVEAITDPVQVQHSRIFPFRVWAAYREAPSDFWSYPLGHTLDHATRNLVGLDGGTLVAIDSSGSMQYPVSGRSTMSRMEVAALTGAAIAHQAPSTTDVVIYGDYNRAVPATPGWSTLKYTQQLVSLCRAVGLGTYGHTAVRDHFVPGKHRRVIIVTDDQQADAGRVNLDHVPRIYTFNLAGYAPSALPSGEGGRYSLGGFNDASFAMIAALERGTAGGWPWEMGAMIDQAVAQHRGALDALA